MWWLLTVLVAAGCVDECEPLIRYSSETGPEGMGCPNLEFEEIEIPTVWYRVGTRAVVRECRDNRGWRQFQCLGYRDWYEFIVSGEER